MAINNYKEELDKNGILAFVPGGNSMWPTLKHAKQTVVILPKTKRLNKYDVGFYITDDGNYVLHRVIEVKPDGYVFVGDSQSKLENVKEDSVIAIMGGFYRGKRYIDVTDSDYIDEVNDLYSNEERRQKRGKAFHKRLILKRRIIKLLTFRWKRGK